jgi:SARP family transcriptional regulator, regulator of embCAB operon
VALHTADRGFLPASDAAWAAQVRGRLEDVRLRALECVAAVGLALGGAELASTERAARRLIELAPFRESGHRALMEALAARGNVAEALLAYERLRVRLRDELGAVPAPEVQALHARLLTGSS